MISNNKLAITFKVNRGKYSLTSDDESVFFTFNLGILNNDEKYKDIKRDYVIYDNLNDFYYDEDASPLEVAEQLKIGIHNYLYNRNKEKIDMLVKLLKKEEENQVTLRLIDEWVDNYNKKIDSQRRMKNAEMELLDKKIDYLKIIKDNNIKLDSLEDLQ